MSKPGLFISFEGGEGGGKTTQLNWLAEYIKEKGHKLVTTREPGGTDEAEKIRNLLVQRKGGNWIPMAECLMMYAARVQHTEQVIKPALSEGRIVISDRYSDSTMAYQGVGRELGTDTIQKLEEITLNGFKPDLTLILDLDPEIGLARSTRRLSAEALGVNQTEDRFENLDLEFHKKLRQAFLDIATKEPERCHVIDATQTAEQIHEQIRLVVDKVV